LCFQKNLQQHNLTCLALLNVLHHFSAIKKPIATTQRLTLSPGHFASHFKNPVTTSNSKKPKDFPQPNCSSLATLENPVTTSKQ
jgi:hypothetical protein